MVISDLPFCADQVNSFKASLYFRRKGSILLQVELGRRLLMWRESNRWNRNFTRSISLSEVDGFRQLLNGTNFQTWEASLTYPVVETGALQHPAAAVHVAQLDGAEKMGNDSPSERESSFSRRWELQFYDASHKLLATYAGENHLPAYFRDFSEKLSYFCRRPFMCMD